jgi:hypothetical protein
MAYGIFITSLLAKLDGNNGQFVLVSLADKENQIQVMLSLLLQILTIPMLRFVKTLLNG